MANHGAMRKMTFSLPEELIEEVREVVEQGIFPSQSFVVREALRNELRRARRELLRREFQEAAKDPLFLRDLKRAETAFQSADAETARMIPDD